MKTQAQPLTDRLRDRLNAEELRELHAVESAAFSKFVHASSNGVAGRLWGVTKEVAIVFAFVWFLSTKWNVFERQVADSANDVAAIQQTLHAVQADLQSIRLEQTRVRTQLDYADEQPATPRRTPRFQPEWTVPVR